MSESWSGVETLTDLEARTETGTFLGTSRHTDAADMRREFSIPSFDEQAFNYPSTVPGALLHAKDNSAYSPAGGTEFLAEGPMGSGKSTLLLEWAIRQLEANDGEAVVWRGDETRSEWTPLAPWARVCLPESCRGGVEALAVSTDEDDAYRREVDLEEVVREVVFYDDVADLWERCVEPGKFHVVYPDPAMRGCQAAYDRSSSHYPELEFSPEDPVRHWWIGALLQRQEFGPYGFTSWICDEIGDIASKDASKDEFATYQKVSLLQDIVVDARKMNLSLFLAGQNPEDIHDMVRRKVRWRITMNGRANPTRGSQVVGFREVPMNTDLTSRMDVGKALMWTETNFEAFSWGDVPKPTGEELRIDLDASISTTPAGESDDSGEGRGVISS